MRTCPISAENSEDNFCCSKMSFLSFQGMVATFYRWDGPKKNCLCQIFGTKNCSYQFLFLHVCTFNGPFPRLPRWTGTTKVKPVWILLKQETASGSGISWAMCKSASRSRQTTTPALHHSVFTGWMPFLSPKQQRQSTEGIFDWVIQEKIGWHFLRHNVYVCAVHFTEKRPVIIAVTEVLHFMLWFTEIKLTSVRSLIVFRDLCCVLLKWLYQR